jgi:hypothetical protein
MDCMEFGDGGNTRNVESPEETRADVFHCPTRNGGEKKENCRAYVGLSGLSQLDGIDAGFPFFLALEDAHFRAGL